MDYEKIKSVAQSYLPYMTRFLRAIVKDPGESAGEKKHVATIKSEMESLKFDEVIVDPQGNVIGYMGKGEKIIAYDAHIDTVGLGNLENWKFDPYEGYENDQEIGGRGVSDQLGGIVSSVYGARIMKDLNLIPDNIKIMVVGSVQEEDCDGLCWQYIINEDKIRPEFVISTEPTDGGIYRGHRGRMEIKIYIHGVSCHGSAPERGDNAAYKAAEIMLDVKALNENSKDHPTIKGLEKMLDEKYNKHAKAARFLGRGTVCVSEVFYTSPSRCAVVDSMTISLDRRMTAGETWEYCLDEIRALPSVKKYGKDVVVSLYQYDKPSYTGLVYPIECYFPTWWIEPEDPICKTMVDVHKNMYGEKRIGKSETKVERQDRPLLDKWTFSTNGVTIMGRNGVKCIGFGPGAESQAHAPNEKTWKNDLVVNAAVYAAVPFTYLKYNKNEDIKVNLKSPFLGFGKLKMKTPLVEIDGDEQAKNMFHWTKDILVKPYVDLKSEYYDLGIKNREKTKNIVCSESAVALKKYGVGVKCSSIIPNAARIQEYGLTQRLENQNEIIKNSICGIKGNTAFTAPIFIDEAAPCVSSWKKPIVLAKNLSEDSILNLSEYARSCFNYAINTKQSLWVISNEIFTSLYEKEFQQIFVDEGISFISLSPLVSLQKVLKSEGGYIWASAPSSKEDVVSNMILSSYGTSMMSEVICSNDGEVYQFQTVHGTVQKHFYRYLKGEETYTNSVGTIFAWAEALKKRGEIDGVDDLIMFADCLEEATEKTIQDGVVPGDLFEVSNVLTKSKVETKAFIKAVDERLFKLLKQ